MARAEITGRKPGARALDGGAPDPKDEDDEQPAPTPRFALSILEFCRTHSISEDFYYKLKRQGKNPKEMKVGARVLISIEAAADWRREREAATAAE